MAAKHPHGRDAPVALRLRNLRTAYGLDTSAAMAVRLGVSPQRYNNAEIGIPLGIDLAQKIVRTFPGVTLDWLYFGEERGLSVGVADRLREAGGKRSKKVAS